MKYTNNNVNQYNCKYDSNFRHEGNEQASGPL